MTNQLVPYSHPCMEQEGWAISVCSGSEHGPFQLQRYDEAAIFASDEEAWKHVVLRASKNSEPHRLALAWLREHAPEEWERVVGGALEVLK